MDEAKPFHIPKRVVWKAFKRVKANRGAAGVDKQSIAEFEADLSTSKRNTCHRMTLGRSPPASVRQARLPVSNGDFF